jgi:membrane-bound metal-dependent hydrolase YbcI (DUF457 family)
MAVQKWSPTRKWLMLEIVLGNLLPDADNIAVAIATLTGNSIVRLHRTFTHSLFFVITIIIVFYGIAWATRKDKFGNLGLGIGIGVLMHILLDLLIWFNGVEILWPLNSWVNLWTGITPPEWWSKLMMPFENLFFALFFLTLASLARRRKTNEEFLPKLRIWTWVQGILFIIFMVMVFTMDSGFLTIFGAVYLLSFGLAFGITIRMSETVETFG